MKYLSSLQKKNLSGETCLLRVDFNIKKEDMEAAGRRPPLRLKESIPTIRFLLKKKAKIVLLSHRGRPQVEDGKYDFSEFTLKVFAKPLSRLLRRPVHFAGLDFENFRKSLARSKPGAVFLLENLRLMAGEEKNDKQFTKMLASFGTFYVNDAFSVSHRANASVAAITNYLPSYGGLLLGKELTNLKKATENHVKPLVVILGGAKISDKIGLIKHLYRKANYFLIGGGIANAIFAGRGMPIGDSLYEKIKLDPVIIEGLKTRKIILPLDTVIRDRKILDIGPETTKLYARTIKKARTIIWNGPMGLIEERKFRRGSDRVAKAIFGSRAFAVIGGGETTLLISNFKFKISNSRIFISTGGGAMLEYLAGVELPGITALNRAKLAL